MMSMRWVLVAVLLVVVAGCGASNEDELRSWMAEQRSQMRPRVTPVSAPTKFKPESYNASALAEAFSKEKLTQALKRDSSRPVVDNALIAPELARRKEALEAFPLDTMSMVGSLIREGKPAALIKVDILLYPVRLGSYLGQNYGRVTKITETEVVLREIVQDAVGEWIERPAVLQLQERSK